MLYTALLNWGGGGGHIYILGQNLAQGFHINQLMSLHAERWKNTTTTKAKQMLMTALQEKSRRVLKEI